jgi:hypothetical protein
MTLLSDTAYHSFIGEVEALNTTTIRRLTPSRRHQLLAIALFSPVSGEFNKSPNETWRQYAPLFREYSTASITPELLASLAQVESAGNPVASTYWRWRLTWNPLAIYQPASSSVGMYQMTDAAFAETRHYCVRDHIVVEDGCSLTGLDSRVPPSRAIELAAVFLDRKITAILRASAKDGGQCTAEAGACCDNPSLRRKLGQGVRAPGLPSRSPVSAVAIR